MLTDEIIKELARPFAFEEHGLKPNIYIYKPAIRLRLHDVDPGWSMTKPELIGIVDNVAVVTAGLTICGVTRWGIGVGPVTQEEPDENGVIVPFGPNKRATFVGKAIKAAHSDCLPRCAEQFGVGNYLKMKPRDIKAEALFREWLAALSRPQHWADGEGAETFTERRKQLQVRWADVKNHLEPGRKITRITDISLPLEAALDRLEELADEGLEEVTYA